MDYIALARTLAYIVLYAIIGLGPGFFCGVIVANLVGARGKGSLTEKKDKNLKSAAVHNAQWHPSHKKWGND